MGNGRLRNGLVVLGLEPLDAGLMARPHGLRVGPSSEGAALVERQRVAFAFFGRGEAAVVAVGVVVLVGSVGGRSLALDGRHSSCCNWAEQLGGPVILLSDKATDGPESLSLLLE